MKFSKYNVYLELENKINVTNTLHSSKAIIKRCDLKGAVICKSILDLNDKEKELYEKGIICEDDADEFLILFYLRNKKYHCEHNLNFNINLRIQKSSDYVLSEDYRKDNTLQRTFELFDELATMTAIDQIKLSISYSEIEKELMEELGIIIECYRSKWRKKGVQLNIEYLVTEDYLGHMFERNRIGDIQQLCVLKSRETDVKSGIEDIEKVVSNIIYLLDNNIILKVDLNSGTLVNAIKELPQNYVDRLYYTRNCINNLDEVIQRIKEHQIYTDLLSSPQLIGGCSAFNDNSFCVDRLGNISKCIKCHDYPIEIIGNVFDQHQKVFQQMIACDFLKKREDFDMECAKACEFFPWCEGGCVERQKGNSICLIRKKLIYILEEISGGGKYIEIT